MANPNIKINYTQIFINNEFIDSQNGKKFAVINPSDESVVAHVSEGDKVDIDKAVQAAKVAFQKESTWRSLKVTERSALLIKLADILERDASKIASILTLENGRPFQFSVMEIMMAVDVFRYYAGWCDKIKGTTMAADDGSLIMTRKEPIGVVGQITPWNAPILLIALKWAPALAVGCTIVIKPAESTPLCALYLAALTKEAGYPSGVINVVPGYGNTAGSALSEHPDIAKITFTGSIGVGKKIMAASGNTNLKRVALELGGKSPLVICEDVNVDQAVTIAHNAIFQNAGQICFAASRTYVHSKIYDEFVRKSREMAIARKIGNPFDSSTIQGPQTNKDMFDRIMNYIKIGKKEGAKLEAGGDRWGSIGYYIKPTIFSNVTDDMTIVKEEIFGPVQTILKFDSLDDVIKRANKTHYGLAAGIITNDINKAIKYSQEIEAGLVWVNQYGNLCYDAPFGGYKQSGIGRELGPDGLEGYLETKTIAIKVSVEN